MSHTLGGQTLAVFGLSLPMFRFAGLRCLIPPPSGRHLRSAHALPTGITAVPLATVAAGADSEHRVALCVEAPPNVQGRDMLVRLLTLHGLWTMILDHGLIGEQFRASGADDAVAHPNCRLMFKNLRFLMTDNTESTSWIPRALTCRVKSKPKMPSRSRNK